MYMLYVYIQFWLEVIEDVRDAWCVLLSDQETSHGLSGCDNQYR